jgi:hypothetical protein
VSNILPFPKSPARFFSGWHIATNHYNGARRPEAYLRPWHADWYDLYPAADACTAECIAIELMRATPGCEYEGGPEGTIPNYSQGGCDVADF